MTKKDPKVSQLYAGLSLEKKIRKEIFDFLQYDAVSVVMNQVGYGYGAKDRQIGEVYKHSVREQEEYREDIHRLGACNLGE